jgi:Fe-S-cluster containining protein
MALEHATGVNASTPRERLYFAFPSGRLTYDCVACGFQCCRGYGYACTNEREVEAQRQRGAALGFFSESMSGRGEGVGCRVSNVRPACFFLRDDGLCDVQVRHGYIAKPETCRLFPFNIVKRLGEQFIVLPHPTLCPLRGKPRGSSSFQSDHERLYHEMVTQGVNSTTPAVSPYNASMLLGVESEVTRCAEQAIDAGSVAVLWDAQCYAATDYCRAAGRKRELPLEDGWFDDAFERIVGVMPQTEWVECEEVVRAVAATVPALRFQMLTTDPTASRRALRVERVPFVIRGLHLIVALARQAGARVLTVTSVIDLFEKFRSLLLVIAHSDLSLRWSSSVLVRVGAAGQGAHEQRAFVSAVRALLRGRRKPAALGTVIAADVSGTVSERVASLRRVAGALCDGLDGLYEGDEASKRAAADAAVRTLLQHWALRILSVDATLALAYGHRPERKRKL